MRLIFLLSLFVIVIINSCTDPDLIGLEVQPVSENIIISDTSSFDWQTSPSLRIKLSNDFGQQILNLGDENLQDNEAFIQEFKGISVKATAANTMLYLTPTSLNTFLKIYYHNDTSNEDSLSLDLNMGQIRVSLFNNKLYNIENDNILSDQNSIYVQSMSGYRSTISILNKDSIDNLLKDKAINKVMMSFDVKPNSQIDYTAHDRLFLVRLDEDGNKIFLTDYTLEGESHFGGYLDNNRYTFNITRYFYQFLNNTSYTNQLYLTPSGDGVNANRTILEKDIILDIYYSQL